MMRIVRALMLAGAVLPGMAWGQQSNFQVSPPPIASPEFSAGQSDMRVSATSISMKGTGFNLTGAGGSFAYREAVDDELALDVAMGMYGFSGDIDMGGSSPGSMSMFMIPFSANVELRAGDKGANSVIMFLGPTMSLSSAQIDYLAPYAFGTVIPASVKTTTSLYGMQVGFQLSLKVGDFWLSPFGMMQSQSGSVTATTGSTSTTSTIPSFTTTSVGLDILHEPSGMTLSSLLQQAAQKDQNAAVKTTIIQLSWKF